ncbi:N-6 DNA methylase [Nocardiopsis sp. CT-R113]|uniref:N-6 DNA methylase n=1 Tax=Nocardiopsis codii TaxID=3065942 RepID=A0ABU7K943_9ACTN|nr:N-6 DNA methylase [Nocardiopsis sp. CT-R113]MEE2038755.1 N-6 DNA methylase [Nocardiopsis sp. CT-R113]
MAEHAHVTAADIARIARVSRTTVSNWRRRHKDFPQAVGGTGNRSLFDRDGVEEWLRRGGRLPERAPHEDVWERVRALASEGGGLEDTVADVQALLLGLVREGGDEDSFVVAARERLAVSQGGSGLAEELLRSAPTQALARELSDHVHDAYQDALGGKAHVTPGPLAELMADLAGVRGADVLDPACGTGTLLRAASARGASDLSGQEVLVSLAALARARTAIVSGDVPAEIVPGDSLTHDGFQGRRFDAVLCNPPFNQRDWGAEQLAYDERWAYGVPPRAESELAWIQHCLAHTRPGGRVVVLMPPAAASRPSGRRIRSELLRRGALRAVIGLPVGAAAPVHVALQLWVLSPPEAEAAPTPVVLFVEAAAGAVAGSDGSERRPVEWEKVNRAVTDTWRGFLRTPGTTADVPGFCRAVPAIELLDDTVDLTPDRHLPVAAPQADPAEARTRAGKVRRRLLLALDSTRSSVPGEGWGAQDGERWQMVTIADLGRSGALVVYQAVSSPLVEPDEGNGPRVLTPGDVNRNVAPSKRLPEPVDPEETGDRTIRAGDVIVPANMARGRHSRVRVAADTDAGALLGHQLYLLRSDPAHVDPWFLAGFLEDEDNLRRAGHGSTVLRVDFRRLRVPLLPLEDQRRYGAAFRELHEFRTELDRAREAASDLGERLAGGLRSGLLAPPAPLPGGAADAP